MKTRQWQTGLRPIVKVLVSIIIFAMLLKALPLIAMPLIVFSQDNSSQIEWTLEESNFIASHPVITYAPDINFPPYEFLENGELRGIVPELLVKIQEDTGITFKPKYYSRWSEALNAVAALQVDLVFATPSDGRKPNMRFTDTVIDIKNILIAPKDSDIDSGMEGLEGKRIGIMIDYVEAELLRNQYPKYNFVPYTQFEKAIRDVSFGEIDAFVSNIGTTSYTLEKAHVTNLRVVAELDLTSGVSFGVRRDYSLLVSILNKSLAAIEDRDKEEIINRWIRLDALKGYSSVFVRNLLAATFVILVIIWLWITFLRRTVKSRTQALLKSQKILTTVIDHIPHLVYVRDKWGKYVIVNQNSANFYKQDREGVIGKSNMELRPNATEADEEKLLSLDREVIAQNEALEFIEQPVVNLDGEQRYYDVYKRPIQVIEGRTDVLTVALDVTDRVNANLEMKQKKEDLRRIEQNLADLDKKATLGSLVGGITHEINNPIGISVTALSHLKVEFEAFKSRVDAKVLTQEALDDYLVTAEDAIAILEKNIERAVDMISSFKRMSVDQLSGTQVTFDLCETIGHVIHSLSHEVKRKQIKVAYQCTHQLLIDSYPGSYSQIITNLMMNSILHGFESDVAVDLREIVIEATAEEKEIVIRYRDNGIGMDAEMLEKVWQPYFTTKRDRGGSGLGMQIIYNTVVRTLGGKILFESALGEGVYCEMRMPRINS